MIGVLVVEDERPLRASWVDGLVGEGFDAIGCEKADEAVEIVQGRLGTPMATRVVVLDLMLETSPEPFRSDRWALARELWRLDPDMVILLVTAVWDKRDVDRITGLSIASRFLSKGSLTTELLAAEIRALLRISRSGQGEATHPVFEFEHVDRAGKGEVFTLDSARLVLKDPDGAEIPMRSSDFWLLELFVRRPGQVVLYDRVPSDVVPRRMPSPFQQSLATPLTEAVSRIGREINPYLATLKKGERRFFTNRKRAGYIFNALVRVIPPG